MAYPLPPVLNQQPSKSILAGYPNQYSVFPGQTLRLHNSFTATSKKSSRKCSVTFYRITKPDGDGELLNLPAVTVLTSGDHSQNAQELIYTETNEASGPQNGIDPTHAGAEDWQWPASLELQVPDTWVSGVYRARLTATDDQSLIHDVIFVVKRRSGETPSKILYKLNLVTVHAYNKSTKEELKISGDKECNSFYENMTTGADNPESTSTLWKVTLRRPISNTSRYWILGRHDYLMIPWLEENGYEVDFCTDVDIDQDSKLELLSRYKLLLSIGHDEYWSTGMRQNVERFISQGGNVAFFSGNTCLWRVHFGDVDPQLGLPTSMTCDKGNSAQIADATGADSWWKTDYGPENTLTGVATRNGGVRNTTGKVDDPFRPPSDENSDDLSANMMPGYKVQHADHWVYSEPFATGLKKDDIFGTPSSGQPNDGSVVGYECDGAAFERDPENPDFIRPTGVDGTPENFVILGWAQLGQFVYISSDEDGERRRLWGVLPRENTTFDSDNSPIIRKPYAATLGLYTVDGGGTVFNCATTDWVRVLCGARLPPAPQDIKTFYPTASSDKDRPAIWGPDAVDKITRNVIHRLS